MMAFTMFDEFLRQNDPTLYLNDLQAIRQQRAMDLEYTLGVMQPAIDYETRNQTFRQRLDEIELQDRLGQERQQREQRYALERAMMGAGFFDVAAPYGITTYGTAPQYDANGNLIYAPATAASVGPVSIVDGMPRVAGLPAAPNPALDLAPIATAPPMVPTSQPGYMVPATPPMSAPGGSIPQFEAPAAPAPVAVGPALSPAAADAGYRQPTRQPEAVRPVLAAVDARTGRVRAFGESRQMRTLTQDDLNMWLMPGMLDPRMQAAVAANPTEFFTDGSAVYYSPTGPFQNPQMNVPFRR